MPENEYTQNYLQYGGQAVVEGVMMRSPRYFSIACRAPDGTIRCHTEAVAKSWFARVSMFRWPLVRGPIALLSSMALGGRALKYSGEIQLEAENKANNGSESIVSDVESGGSLQSSGIIFALVGGLAIGLLLFVALPNVLAEFITRHHDSEGMLKNAVAGILKILFFTGYIWLIGTHESTRRIFMYHGAEHKAINTLEAHEPLDMDHCRQQSRLHPRCGTSFAIIVLLVSLIVFTFVPRYPFPQLNTALSLLVRIGLEFLILPVIAGISYELLRLAGKFRSQRVVSFFFLPGIWSQYLTTREPDESQIEVALTALKAVMDAERSGLNLASQSTESTIA